MWDIANCLLLDNDEVTMDNPSPSNAYKDDQSSSLTETMTNNNVDASCVDLSVSSRIKLPENSSRSNEPLIDHTSREKTLDSVRYESEIQTDADTIASSQETELLQEPSS